jgi:energy-coupling factor transporter ATP-binding protein EcfA2
MEDSTEPYLAGLKYHAMPPLKRFRDMEHLSGGEKTIAALALLFAIHSYQPSPFFVLDEVDAALDNVNVGRVAKYVKEHATPGMQFIVISLKAGFFQESESLVGVMRDQAKMSSRVVSLDVRSTPSVHSNACANHVAVEKVSTCVKGESSGLGVRSELGIGAVSVRSGVVGVILRLLVSMRRGAMTLRSASERKYSSCLRLYGWRFSHWHNRGAMGVHGKQYMYA